MRWGAGEPPEAVRDDHDRRAAVAALLAPSSIAIVGASDRSRWSTTAFDNLTQGGFTGAVHLVNPRGGMVHGRPAAPSCSGIGAPVDLGLVMTPPAAVADAIADLAASGARSAVILTAGFSETGPQGLERQAAVCRVAAEHGVRLLGPNCLGFINFVDRAHVWTTPVLAPSSHSGVAIVSQSGATAYFLALLAHQQDVGLSHVVSTGNEADLDSASFIDHLIDEPNARSIAVFAETFRHPARFLAVARRARDAGKPLVVLKVGASEVTAKAAIAHTGALVGDDRVFDGICQQLGIIRAHSMEELLATADVVARTGELRQGGLCVVTNSGGVGEIAADTAALRGIALPGPSDTTAARLRAAIPESATAHNPLDLTGSVAPEQCEAAVQALADQPDYAAILCPWYEIPTTPAQVNERLTQLHARLTAGMAAAPTPGFLVSYTNTSVNALARDIVARTGANYLACGLDRAISGLAGAFWWSGHQRAHRASRQLVPESRPAATAPAGDPAGERPHSEHEALAFLTRRGVPVVPTSLATDAPQAVAIARAVGAPVAIKIASPDIAHKSDIGAVALNIQGDDAVRGAFEQVMAAARSRCPSARVDGAVVAPMRSGGIELFVGVTRDPQWGPVLAVGLGGIWVEVLHDVALRPLPVGAADIRHMLEGLRGARLLSGQRGMPAADLDAVARAIAAVAHAAVDCGPALEALDVNPLWVRGSQVEALDALFVWNETDSAPPLQPTIQPEGAAAR